MVCLSTYSYSIFFSDDGGRSGVNINQQSSAHVIQTASQGNVHYSLSSGNQVGAVLLKKKKK